MSNNRILPIQHLEAKAGSGLPRVARNKITVAFIGDRVEEGWTVDQVCHQFQMTEGEVHAALSWYFDHRAELSQCEHEVEQRISRFVQFEAYP